MRIDYTTLSLSEEKAYIGLTTNRSENNGDELTNIENKLDKIMD